MSGMWIAGLRDTGARGPLSNGNSHMPVQGLRTRDDQSGPERGGTGALLPRCLSALLQESGPTLAGAHRGVQPRRARRVYVRLPERCGSACNATQILDVGCAEGSLLRAVANLAPGSVRVGVEPNPAFGTFAEAWAGATVYRDLAEVERSGRTFDLITVSHVLEHVREPVEFLKRLSALCSSTGTLFVDVPDAARYRSLNDLHIAHLFHFSSASLENVGMRAGLVPVRLEKHSPTRHPLSVRALFRSAVVASTLVSDTERQLVRRQIRRLALWSPASRSGARRSLVRCSGRCARGRIGRVRRSAQFGASMKDFHSWCRAEDEASRPWLVLGKGPSFAKRAQYDLTAYSVLTLNHAIRDQRARVAHIIDLDVVGDCAEILSANADFVVMPWIPHVRNRPGKEDLQSIASGNPVLRALQGEGRLLWYNLGSSAPRAQPGSPVVPVRYFSAEAAIGLLASAGVRTVRSLGIDGGSSYSSEFRDIADKTLLANGRSSFDQQFAAIANILLTTGVDYAPLDVESPIRVFVASDEGQIIPTRVLEYSIRKHTSMSVTVTPMHGQVPHTPVPKDEKNRARTPFSFQRFLVPQLAGHRGRAIYIDSDMQVFHNMRELWNMPIGDAGLLCVGEPSDTGRRPQFSVMLLDCEALKWDIHRIVADLDSGVLTYEDLMYRMKIAPAFRADIDQRWNSLERYEAGRTALLHYTDMNTQPWIYARHPFGHLWFRDLLEAVSAGFIPTDLVREHVQRGFLRPSVLYQVEHGIVDPILLPKKAMLLDCGYAPPYRSLHQHSASAWISGPRYLAALARHAYQRSILQRIERSLRDRLSRRWRSRSAHRV